MEYHALPLKGLPILVVEDDPLIALDVSMTLEDVGASIVGPCESLALFQSLVSELTSSITLRGAVLDVELSDGTSLPIARWLTEHDVLFIFHTGMNPAKTDCLLEFDVPVISKPSSVKVLIAAIVGQVHQRGP